MAEATARPPLPVASGLQPAVFSYFRFNPAVHGHEKPFEILINLPSMEKDPSNFRRTNQEFEECHTTVKDARGRENEFSLDRNGVCWRTWEGPREWLSINADALKGRGHQWIRDGYIKEVEEFIKSELERLDGKAVDFVKVFDYKVRGCVPGRIFGVTR